MGTHSEVWRVLLALLRQLVLAFIRPQLIPDRTLCQREREQTDVLDGVRVTARTIRQINSPAAVEPALPATLRGNGRRTDEILCPSHASLRRSCDHERARGSNDTGGGGATVAALRMSLRRRRLRSRVPGRAVLRGGRARVAARRGRGRRGRERVRRQWWWWEMRRAHVGVPGLRAGVGRCRRRRRARTGALCARQGRS